MAKKNNPKAEKAKRNLEYAKLHKKKAKPFRGRSGGGPRPSFSDRPAEARPAAPGEDAPAPELAPV